MKLLFTELEVQIVAFMYIPYPIFTKKKILYLLICDMTMNLPDIPYIATVITAFHYNFFFQQVHFDNGSHLVSHHEEDIEGKKQGPDRFPHNNFR